MDEARVCSSLHGLLEILLEYYAICVTQLRYTKFALQTRNNFLSERCIDARMHNAGTREQLSFRGTSARHIDRTVWVQFCFPERMLFFDGTTNDGVCGGISEISGQGAEAENFRRPV